MNHQGFNFKTRNWVFLQMLNNQYTLIKRHMASVLSSYKLLCPRIKKSQDNSYQVVWGRWESLRPEKICLSIGSSSFGFSWRSTKNLKKKSYKSLSTDMILNTCDSISDPWLFTLRSEQTPRFAEFGNTLATLLLVKKANCHQTETCLMYQMVHF